MFLLSIQLVSDPFERSFIANANHGGPQSATSAEVKVPISAMFSESSKQNSFENSFSL